MERREGEKTEGGGDIGRGPDQVLEEIDAPDHRGVSVEKGYCLGVDSTRMR